MSDARPYKDESGQAFPCRVSDGYDEDGMTLRDYFAGQALAGLAANPHNGRADVQDANWAYQIADAMIEARKVAPRTAT